MSVKTKILVLTILFGIQSVLQLISGFIGLLEKVPFSEYADSFVSAGIMGFVAYSFYFSRDKWTYWLTVLIVATTMARIVMGGLLILSGITLSTSEVVTMVISALIFAIIPLVLLLNRDVRIEFVDKKVPDTISPVMV